MTKKITLPFVIWGAYTLDLSCWILSLKSAVSSFVKHTDRMQEIAHYVLREIHKRNFEAVRIKKDLEDYGFLDTNGAEVEFEYEGVTFHMRWREKNNCVVFVIPSREVLEINSISSAERPREVNALDLILALSHE